MRPEGLRTRGTEESTGASFSPTHSPPDDKGRDPDKAVYSCHESGL